MASRSQSGPGLHRMAHGEGGYSREMVAARPLLSPPLACSIARFLRSPLACFFGSSPSPPARGRSSPHAPPLPDPEGALPLGVVLSASHLRAPWVSTRDRFPRRVRTPKPSSAAGPWGPAAATPDRLLRQVRTPKPSSAAGPWGPAAATPDRLLRRGRTPKPAPAAMPAAFRDSTAAISESSLRARMDGRRRGAPLPQGPSGDGPTAVGDARPLQVRAQSGRTRASLVDRRCPERVPGRGLFHACLAGTRGSPRAARPPRRDERLSGGRVRA